MHMQNRTSPTPPPGIRLIITHKVGQDVVVTAAVLPQGHDLWERKINRVNHPWDEIKEPCISTQRQPVIAARMQDAADNEGKDRGEASLKETEKMQISPRFENITPLERNSMFLPTRLVWK